MASWTRQSSRKIFRCQMTAQTKRYSLKSIRISKGNTNRNSYPQLRRKSILAWISSRETVTTDSPTWRKTQMSSAPRQQCWRKANRWVARCLSFTRRQSVRRYTPRLSSGNTLSHSWVGSGRKLFKSDFSYMQKRKVLTLLLIQQANKILLGMKKRGFGAGRWNGFGGKVETG